MHDLATFKRLNEPEPEGIPISLLTAVLTKAGIEAAYPGGVAGFRADHPHVKSDRHLLAIVSMSSNELQEQLDAIAAKGVDLAGCCAVADMFAGPFQGCAGIEFLTTGDTPLQPGWVARAAPPGTWKRWNR
jgi:hypothetical protein